MNLKQLMDFLFSAIVKPQSKTDLAECLGMTVDDLLFLLDFFTPRGHVIHEHDGTVQIVPFDPTCCGYVGTDGRQCKTIPKDKDYFCSHHYKYCAMSPEIRLFAQYLGLYGFPNGSKTCAWKRGDARKVKRIVQDFYPRTSRDRGFLGLVARLQKKIAAGAGLTEEDEEKLRVMIRRSCLTRCLVANGQTESASQKIGTALRKPPRNLGFKPKGIGTNRNRQI